MAANIQQSAREKVEIHRAFDKKFVCEDGSIFKAIPEVQVTIQGTLQGSQEFQGGISTDFQGLQGFPNQYDNLDFRAFGDNYQDHVSKLYSPLCMNYTIFIPTLHELEYVT